MTSFRAGQEARGRRLDTWLAEVSGRSRTEVQKLIGLGLVLIEGQPAAKSETISAGQTVELREPAPPAIASPAPSASFVIRYEDSDLAVVSKPAGVVVHPAPGHRHETLIEALGEVMPLAPSAGEGRPGVIHRLDKDTSGLLVVAKTDAARSALQAMMRRREITREYLALVAGEFSLARGRVEAPLDRSARDPRRVRVTAGGRQAATEFEVIEEFEGASLVRATLVTGRTHQIRVHFNHIGHPVLGDRVYGGGSRTLARRLGLRRQFLHAIKIRFRHPISGEELEVVDELGYDLRRAIERLRR